MLSGVEHILCDLRDKKQAAINKKKKNVTEKNWPCWGVRMASLPKPTLGLPHSHCPGYVCLPILFKRSYASACEQGFNVTFTQVTHLRQRSFCHLKMSLNYIGQNLELVRLVRRY